MLEINSDNRKPQGIGGWLQVLVRMLTLWHPVVYGLSCASAFSAVAVRGPVTAVVIVARLLCVAIGVAAGMALRTGRETAVTLAMVSLALSAAMDAYVYNSSYYPSNMQPGQAPLYVAATVVYYALWMLYLARSQRVKNTFA
jgi:hypothetical protein